METTQPTSSSSPGESAAPPSAPPAAALSVAAPPAPPLPPPTVESQINQQAYAVGYLTQQIQGLSLAGGAQMPTHQYASPGATANWVPQQVAPQTGAAFIQAGAHQVPLVGLQQQQVQHKMPQQYTPQPMGQPFQQQLGAPYSGAVSYGGGHGVSHGGYGGQGRAYDDYQTKSDLQGR